MVGGGGGGGAASDRDPNDDTRDEECGSLSASPASSPPTGFFSPLPLLNFADSAYSPLSFDSSDMAHLGLDSPRSHGGEHGEGEKLMEHAGEPGPVMDAAGLPAAPSSRRSRGGASTATSAAPENFGAQGISASNGDIGRQLAAPHPTRATERGYDLISSPNFGPTSSPSASTRLLSSSASPLHSGSPEPDEVGTRAAPSRPRPPSTAPIDATTEPAPIRPLNRTIPARPSDSGEAFPTTTALVRPTARRVSGSPDSAGTSPTAAAPPAIAAEPTLVRKISNASVALSHPSPNLNVPARSGAYLGNIAALEATAEQFSMTSSIEDAIRNAHDELKRSDSRRSSILRANSVVSRSERSQISSAGVSRQSSILETNQAARSGGYSPAAFIMSPTNSFTNGGMPSVSRLRSTSKASSLGVPPLTIPTDNGLLSADVGDGEGYPFLSRHGPGKSSVRSVMSSSRFSLAEIAEIEPPTTLTQEALDAADKMVADGGENEDDDTIRVTAHQHVEDAHLAEGMGEEDDQETPGAQTYQPILDVDFGQPSPGLQLHDPNNPQYAHYNPDDDRPTTRGTNATFEEENAFGDFDGVHCEPEPTFGDQAPAIEPEFPPPMPELRQRREPPPRPKSYFDPMTGQQMLFYPARVPAMLNLPPKLSKNAKQQAVRNVRRSQVLSAMMMQPEQEPPRQSRVWLPDPLEGLGEMGAPFMGEQAGRLVEPSAGGPVLEAEPSPGFDMSPPLESTEMLPTLVEPSAHPMLQPGARTTMMSLPQEERQLRRPGRLTDADKRKSRMSVLDNVPPQLRASAFFDQPSAGPRLEVKDGSAMATLDSILDAAASAPVNAFTDHAFAGKLGSEVYGHEKRPKKKDRQSTAALTVMEQPKARASMFSVLGAKKSSQYLGTDDRRSIVGGSSAGGSMRETASGGRSNDGHSPNTDQEPFSPNMLAPDEDENADSESEEEDEAEGPEYQGAPTTLLAELQLRKQQQKMRTQPITRMYPNGLHSTLLELDAVAEVERKQRKGKRVNLAWEDPMMNPELSDEDDEDIPLGMLQAAKAAAGGNAANRSTMDITAVMGEVNRPLGLMERKELEDNEPLSRRRDRLQGRQPVPVFGANNNPGIGMGRDSTMLAAKRMSTLTLTPTIAALNGTGALGAGSQNPMVGSQDGAGGEAGEGDQADPEIEGETLGARKRRLEAENPLPRARPVSGAFSAELLSQFGDIEPDEPSTPARDLKGKGKVVSTIRKVSDREKENTPPPTTEPNGVPEEEETLGQRRRRLQAEREAREREMGSGARPGPAAAKPSQAPAQHARASSFSTANRLSRRLSMADVLGAHPFDTAQGAVDPRDRERLQREEAAARARQAQDLKLAAVRAQMPSSLQSPAVGSRNGGYMGGRFNDGLGGGVGAANMGRSLGYAAAASTGDLRGHMSMQVGSQQLQQQQQQRVGYPGFGVQQPAFGGAAYQNPAMGGYVNGNPSMMMNGYAAAPYGGMPMQMPMGQMQMGMGMPVNMGMGMNMMPTTQSQVDMVERWRQSIMP